MSKYFLCALSVSLFLLSCSNLKNIKVSQVEAIWFEYSPNQNLNNGSTFQGEILLQTYDGKQHDVSKNNKISFRSSDLRKSGNSYTIVKKSKAFNDDQCHLSLKYENKGEVYSSKDSMQMNFRGDLAILYNGAHGNNGKDQRNRTTPLLLRDGKNGETGENGGDGGASKSYTAHVWTIETMVYVHVKENNSNNFMKYKMTIGNDLLFNLSGGNGGDGGDGGDGGNGKNGSISGDKIKRAGDAGNGGNAGNGGSGGNGGNLNLFIHENSFAIENQLTIKTKGGHYGNRGEPGKRGVPGTPLSGQQAGRQGYPGSQGSAGYRGSDGSVQKYIQNFDFSAYME